MAGFDPRTFYEGTQLYESGGLYDGWDYRGENPGPWYVELGADLSANGIGDWFTLDDPVKGELNNIVYLLTGDLFVDITRYVRSLSVKRGRSRFLEKFITGACEIVLDNRNRLFDPTLTGAPFTGQIIPRKPLRIFYDTFPVFTGNVQDWDFDYSVKDATATVKCLDAFSTLATQTVPAQTMTTQLTGARVNYVLDQVGFPAELRSVESGTASVAADTVGDSVNALAYLQKIEVSQNGLFFMSADGLITFEDSFTGTPTPVEVGDGGVPISDLDVVFGAEELTNRVTVNYYSGSVQTSLIIDSTPSQDKYGLFDTSVDTLLSGSVSASALGVLLVNRYEEPQYRIDSAVFNVAGLDTSGQNQILSLELGDQILLKFRPLGVGETIERNVLVDAIDHSAAPKTHTVSLALTDLGI
jgi:hypothetical protein